MVAASSAIGAAVALVAALALVGLRLDVPSLASVVPGGIGMKANTALALALAGFSLWMQPSTRPIAVWPRRLLAAVVAVIGLLTMCEYLVGWDIGIDQLLVREAPGARGTAIPGRMGPIAAMNTVVAGIALLLIDLPLQRGRWTGQSLALLGIPTAFLPIVGYAYGVEKLYGIAGWTAIAVNTAFAIAALHVGILLARPDRGFMTLVASETTGSAMARRSILYAVAVPLGLGWLVIEGWNHGLYDGRFALSLLVLVIILLLAGLPWRDARVLNRMEEQRELARRSREHALDQLAEALAREQEARGRAEAASRTKDQFLATLSHELRTPLNAILGWARLLKDRKGERGALDRGLDVIERAARTQAQLVEDLLDMSRIVTGRVRLELRDVQLARVVDAAVEAILPAAAAKAIRIERLLDPDAWTVRGDGTRLQQVVWNLLSNAVKFTPEGGAVEVRLGREGDQAVISVRDSGIGIPAEFLPSVFDRFTQADGTASRRHGGLGLGLAIARHLAELHGGTLAATSAGEGKGATFTLRLRRAQAHAAAAEPATPRRADPDLAGITVLVVDDEADAREVLAQLLEMRHARVLAAASAAEALDVLEHERPDVLISDIAMPVEDGYALVERLRRAEASRGGPGLPAIALTAFARDEDRGRAIAAGFQLHVSKPVEPVDLVGAIVRLAGRPAAAAEA